MERAFGQKNELAPNLIFMLFLPQKLPAEKAADHLTKAKEKKLFFQNNTNLFQALKQWAKRRKKKAREKLARREKGKRKEGL